jgi:Ca-activated chloride channel family protein
MSNKAGAGVVVVMFSLSCLGWSYSAARKNNQGNECYQKGEYDQALKKYSEAMTEAPEKAEIYFNVGDALYKQSKFPESLKLYEKSAAPGDAKLQSKVFYNIGNSKFRMGKAGADLNALQEAAACYEKALEIAPGDRDAKYNLEFALREIKKIEEQNKKEEKNKDTNKEFLRYFPPNHFSIPPSDFIP